MRNFVAVVALLLAPVVADGAQPDFSGHWKQQTQSKSQRQLEIEQDGQNLRVKTIAAGSEGARSLEVKYVIGGAATTYKGLDGDEFESSAHWENSTLIFVIAEHEDGKEIPQRASWTLSVDGNTLQVERVSTKSGDTTRSVSIYVRQP